MSSVTFTASLISTLIVTKSQHDSANLQQLKQIIKLQQDQNNQFRVYYNSQTPLNQVTRSDAIKNLSNFVVQDINDSRAKVKFIKKQAQPVADSLYVSLTLQVFTSNNNYLTDLTIIVSDQTTNQQAKFKE